MGLGNESCRGLFMRAAGDVKFHLRRRQIELPQCKAAGDRKIGLATVKRGTKLTPARSERGRFGETHSVRTLAEKHFRERDPREGYALKQENPPAKPTERPGRQWAAPGP
jgi:hypothetical protein